MMAERLLVVTDGDEWHDALSTPFRDATVMVAEGLVELTDDTAFDTLVVDRRRLDLAWLDGLISTLGPRLRRDARVLVALGSTSREAEIDASESPALPGLEWAGLSMAGERLCAELRTRHGDVPSVGTAALIVAADSAATLMARDRPTTQEVRRLFTTHEAERRRSERALLAHLAEATSRSATLSAEPGKRANVSAQPVTVKALLRTSPSGRRLLRVLGRGKRLIRRAGDAFRRS